MSVFQIISLLISLAAAAAYINRRFLKQPATIGLMSLALIMSMLAIGANRLGWIDLSSAGMFVNQINFSDVLLHGMLSFLLFAGAMHINLADLKKHQVLVATMSTVGVVIATFVTGSLVWLAAHWLGFELSYIYALLFGALISPTDPVAVLGILQETKLSKNLRIKIGCESLLNDGVGVVMFVLLLAMATRPELQISGLDIILIVIWKGLGSIIIGLTLGWITYKLLHGVDDYKLEVLLTLALVTGGYSLAEAMELSAPITVVIAGLVIGNHAELFGGVHKKQSHVRLFWELADDIMNAVLFTLIGLEMMVINFSTLYLTMGLAAIITVLAGRFISVAVPVSIMGLRYRFERGTIALLTWGGLRGGISIALALSLPPSPERDPILSMTYIAVVFSVLFQGTTFRHVAGMIVRK